jgi:spermidine/putrescine transport system permease protein
VTDAFWRRFLVPGGLWLLLFFLVPFVIAVLISLGSNNEFGGVTYGWNPENYGDALDPLFAPVLLRSVGYAAATAAICLLIGYPTAYCIARYGGRRRNLLIAAILAPFLINYLVRTYAWVALLADEGLVNSVITDTGASSVQFLNTPWAVIGGLVYGYLGFMILPIYASLERMDPALIEAGKDLYGTPSQTFWHVTWPQTLPGVLAGTVLVFLPAVGDFVSAQLLGGPDTYMVGNLIQQQFFGADNWPFGSALTIVLMAFLALFMFFYLRGAGSRERREALV